MVRRPEGHEFLLPNELGWECNDEISEYMDTWRDEVLTHSSNFRNESLAWTVFKAQLMDNVYAIVKKYQEKDKNNG